MHMVNDKGEAIYARKVKHAQKDFLTEQGVKAIY